MLDTWFSSSLWPFSTLGWPDETPELARYYPTDVLVTGFDIIFFWVARMMMMGLHFMEEVPFREVYIHALVRDEKGQKMSKSKGNVIDPLELIDAYGADALRFTLAAMAAQGRDIKLATSRVEGYRNFATKLWNAARFAEMNACAPAENFDPGKAKATVNRWIAGESERAAAAVTEALENFRFNEAAAAIYTFIWHVFCDWYLELAKPLLAGEAELAAETRAMTAWVLDRALHLLHPFMPFVTEELWAQARAREGGARQPLDAEPLAAPSRARECRGRCRDRLADPFRLRGALGARRDERAGRRARAAAHLRREQGDRGPHRATRGDAAAARAPRKHRLQAPAPKGAVQIVLDEATLALPLGGVIDVAVEIEAAQARDRQGAVRRSPSSTPSSATRNSSPARPSMWSRSSASARSRPRPSPRASRKP